MAKYIYILAGTFRRTQFRQLFLDKPRRIERPPFATDANNTEDQDDDGCDKNCRRNKASIMFIYLYFGVKPYTKRKPELRNTLDDWEESGEVPGRRTTG